MAQPGQDTVQAPNQLQTIQALLGLLSGGGQTTSTNPGDVSYLQSLFAEMQGADYQGLLERIFQQAQGAIPGLQAAYSNAAGARSGSNSAVAASLQELLKTTTVEAQSNLANQQLQNQQVRQAAGANIAQATQGTRQSTKQNTLTGSPIGDLAAMFALLKGTQQLTGSKSVNEMLGKVTGLTSTAGQPAASAMSGISAPAPAAAVTSAPGYSLATGSGAPGLSFGGVRAPAASPEFTFTPTAFVPADYGFAPTNMSSMGLQAPASQGPYEIGSFDYGLSSGSGAPGLKFDLSQWNW